MRRNSTCTWCRENLKRNEYRIENGSGDHDERFCSLDHTEAFIEYRFEGHIISGMKSIVPVKRRARARHTVRIKFSSDLRLYDDRIRETGRT
jgi:hypothetical protein